MHLYDIEGTIISFISLCNLPSIRSARPYLKLITFIPSLSAAASEFSTLHTQTYEHREMNRVNIYEHLGVYKLYREDINNKYTYIL